MAIRVIQADVEAIILREFTTGDNINPFIAVASRLVDWLEVEDTDSVLSAAELIDIELYISAHFYAKANQRFSDKKTEGASATFQGTTAMFLQYTDYGQVALLLDTTGNLAKRQKEAVSGKQEAQILYIGDLA